MCMCFSLILYYINVFAETGYELITPDVLKERQKSDPHYLFDYVIECSGFAPATEHAFSLLNYGGTLCIFGVSPPHAKIRWVSKITHFQVITFFFIYRQH